MTNKVPYQQYLLDCLQQQQGNIQRHQLPNGETVWVRRADTHNSIWAYRLLGIFTRLLRADALKPVPSLGGEIAIKNEAAALKRLTDAGIIVPTLLAITDNALMMSELSHSETLMDVLSTSDNRLADWQRGVNAIVELHQKNQYVSQCFSRNMLNFPDSRIGFIDFEDAPEKVLTLQQCQTRDWLCYLHSTAFLLDTDNYRLQAIKIFHQALGDSTDSVITDISRNTKCLVWAKRLTHRRWGRDALRVAALMRFIYELR